MATWVPIKHTEIKARCTNKLCGHKENIPLFEKWFFIDKQPCPQCGFKTLDIFACEVGNNRLRELKDGNDKLDIVATRNPRAIPSGFEDY